MKLTSLVKNFFFATTFLFFLGCSSSAVEEVVEEEVVIEEPATDPFYDVLNETSTLDDYWELFQQDAIRSGKADPGLNRTIDLFFGAEPDFASGVTADHAGRAYDICNDNNIRFEIIKSYWEDYSVARRLNTFYHEMGHARYKYRHPCESNEVCTYEYEDYPIMWRAGTQSYSMADFIKAKDDFFKRDWEGIRYFNCN